MEAETLWRKNENMTTKSWHEKWKGFLEIFDTAAAYSLAQNAGLCVIESQILYVHIRNIHKVHIGKQHVWHLRIQKINLKVFVKK